MMVYYTIGGELYHHGIMGQKWGERNGPPYPLDKKMSRQITKIRKTKMKSLKAQGKSVNLRIKEEKLKRQVNTLKKDKVNDTTAKQEKIQNKINRLEKKANSYDIKSHKTMAKSEKLVSNYLKKYGSQSITLINDTKIYKAQAKVENALAKISKQQRKTLKQSYRM